MFCDRNCVILVVVNFKESNSGSVLLLERALTHGLLRGLLRLGLARRAGGGGGGERSRCRSALPIKQGLLVVGRVGEGRLGGRQRGGRRGGNYGMPRHNFSRTEAGLPLQPRNHAARSEWTGSRIG